MNIKPGALIFFWMGLIVCVVGVGVGYNFSRRESSPVENAKQPKKPELFSPGVGKRGMTQLHYDAYCGNLPGLIWCLDDGMKVNATDDAGYTALHWVADMAAVDGPRIEMMRELVKRGANVNLKTKDGTTALMLARAAGSNLGDKLAKELVAVGAK